MAEISGRVVEKILLRSRLVEHVLLIEWSIEQIDIFESLLERIPSAGGGATFRSPVFGGHRSAAGRQNQWQMVLNLNHICSSTLSLYLHPSSGPKEEAGPQTGVNAQYRFGIVNSEGWFEYESTGQNVFGLPSSANSPPGEAGQHPTVLFNWSKLAGEKYKFLSGDRLCIRCEITTLELEQDLYE